MYPTYVYSYPPYYVRTEEESSDDDEQIDRLNRRINELEQQERKVDREVIKDENTVVATSYVSMAAVAVALFVILVLVVVVYMMSQKKK